MRLLIENAQQIDFVQKCIGQENIQAPQKDVGDFFKP